MNESFHFAPKYKQSTNMTIFIVLQAMRDLNKTTVDIARQFNLSSTQVHNIFSAYVDLKRLPLSRIICVDEVYLNISKNERYAFVIMDFQTNQIIDILQNRYKFTIEYYFYHIPFEERKRVQFIISDAYYFYQHGLLELFPNAKQVLDSFHVIQWLNNQIHQIILNVYRHHCSFDFKQWSLRNPNKSIQTSIKIHIKMPMKPNRHSSTSSMPLNILNRKHLGILANF